MKSMPIVLLKYTEVFPCSVFSLMENFESDFNCLIRSENIRSLKGFHNTL